MYQYIMYVYTGYVLTYSALSVLLKLFIVNRLCEMYNLF